MFHFFFFTTKNVPSSCSSRRTHVFILSFPCQGFLAPKPPRGAVEGPGVGCFYSCRPCRTHIFSLLRPVLPIKPRFVLGPLSPRVGKPKLNSIRAFCTPIPSLHGGAKHPQPTIDPRAVQFLLVGLCWFSHPCTRLAGRAKT